MRRKGRSLSPRNPATASPTSSATTASTPRSTWSAARRYGARFLLVHSSNALVYPYRYDQGDGDATAPFRPFLGVPSATFVGNHLYLYYTAGRNYDPQGHYRYPYLDSAAGAHEAVEAFNNGAGIDQVTVLRVFSEDEINYQVRRGWGDDDEPNWTVASVIRGGPGLPIRIWEAVAGARFQVRSFESVVLAAARRSGSLAPWAKDDGGPRIKIVDPMPLVCGDELSLYIAVQPAAPTLLPAWSPVADRADWLYGLWRLRGVRPSDVRQLNVEGTLIAPEFGRDFVVAESGPSRASQDQLAKGYARNADDDHNEEPGEEFYMYKDPDVLYVPLLDRWRIYTHVNNQLVYFDADEETVCVSASDAWGTSWPEWDEVIEATTEAARFLGAPP